MSWKTGFYFFCDELNAVNGIEGLGIPFRPHIGGSETALARVEGPAAETMKGGFVGHGEEIIKSEKS